MPGKPNLTDREWLAPDAEGIRVAWLSDPNRSSLRAKRLRRAFNRPVPFLDTWPAATRELLAAWVKRATAEKAIGRDSLLRKAGPTRTNTALALFETLLREGLAEIEERREARLDWQIHSLRFLDPSSLRRALGLPEPDESLNAWNAAKQRSFELPDLEAARAGLDALPARSALARQQLLDAVERWCAEGRDGGFATQRDFAFFARGDTKKISDAEWRWLADNLDLAGYGIAAHTPILLIATDCRLVTSNGVVDLAAVPGFVGLPPASIQDLREIGNAPTLWRVVENRSAFEKVAAARADREAVLWVPGYPPGWWRAVVATLLEHAPAPAHIACDPDPDGIAIAMLTARKWLDAGLVWTPWRMAPADLLALATRRPLSERDVALLGSLREHTLPTPLDALAAAMSELGEKGEQESLFWQDR